MNMPLLLENETTWQSGLKRARCLRIVDETPDVKTFWFALEDHQPLGFKPGQFLSFNFTIEGKEVIRCYSISSSPAQPYQFGVTIKRVPGGQVSNWLHDTLTVGESVTVSPAAGHFNCIDIAADKYLLLSGGSGITPGMSMVRWMMDAGQLGDVHFVHSARSPEDIIFNHELLQIDAQWPDFRLATLCEETAPGQGWSGYRGRLTPELLRCICPDYQQRTVMCCGPAPYMQAVREMLEALNFPMHQYYEESFGGPAPQASEPAGEVTGEAREVISAQLSFTTTNKQVAGGSDTSVLDSAQAAGVWIPAGCRTGICGSCKVMKTSGSVIMDDPMALSGDERDAGYILACCAYPQDDLAIEA